jgi:hypothetical protein
VGLLLSPAAHAVTEGPIVWKVKGSVRDGHLIVRTALPQLEMGTLRMVVKTLAASEPCLQYLIGGAAVRRLCVNGAHPPYPGTHMHMINPLKTEEDAYESAEIPAVPLAPRVAPGTYRAILEAFAGECKIALGDDFVWVEPRRER